MCLYLICKDYRKSLGPKLKKNLSSLPRAWQGPRQRPPLCREPNAVALGKGDANGCRYQRCSFADSLSLPSARLSAKLAFAEGVPLPRAWPSVKVLCRGSTLAVGKGSLCRGLALGKAEPSAKLSFPVVKRPRMARWPVEDDRELYRCNTLVLSELKHDMSSWALHSLLLSKPWCINLK